MPTDYSPSGSRRSSRQGGRRPHRGDRSATSTRQEAKPAPKKSLIAKILGFFSGESEATVPSPAASGYSRSESPERSRSPRGERSERQPRGERSERSDRGDRSDRQGRTDRPTGMRKPEIVEVTSARLYVGNLSFDAAESDLLELFNGVGLVQNVEVVTNRHTMRSKGFAFVQMQTVDEAKRAVETLHDKDYMGRKLVVSGAKAVEERRSERTRQPEQ
jgi:RNA recognition motif-containing protein